MRSIILTSLLAFALAAPAEAARKSRTRVARAPGKWAALDPHCAPLAPQPGGVCAPYDRDHCRFAQGVLQRGDARDPDAPYLLVPLRQDQYCVYDASARAVGVTKVLEPRAQRLRDRAMRRHLR